MENQRIARELVRLAADLLDEESKKVTKATVKAILKKMKVDLVSDGVRVQYVPDEKDLDECRELGKSVASRLKEMVNA